MEEIQIERDYLPAERVLRPAPRPVALLLAQREAMEEYGVSDAKHTPPSAIHGHYPHVYLWDSCFSAQTFARLGYIKEAVEEMESVFQGQHENGFIPNMQFAPNGRTYDPERRTFMKPREHSDYTQPPLMAETILDIYEAYLDYGEEEKGQAFLEAFYPKLKSAYDFFRNERQNSPDDPLVGNIHPHETGRDSDPTFDFIKLRLERDGVNTSKTYDYINTALDYASIITYNIRARARKWDTEKLREIFWVNDVMFNTIYVKNLRALADISTHLEKYEDEFELRDLAAKVEDQILGQMWDPGARGGSGAFYALNKTSPKPPSPGINHIQQSNPHTEPKDEKIRVTSISNLFAVQLENISLEQLKSCIDLIESSFNTTHVLPTVATDSPHYDPHYQQKNMWRGPVWVWMNNCISDAFTMQAKRLKKLMWSGEISHREAGKIMRDCKYLSKKINTSTQNLTKTTHGEFYDTITGEPKRTMPFSGSATVSKSSLES